MKKIVSLAISLLREALYSVALEAAKDFFRMVFEFFISLL